MTSQTVQIAENRRWVKRWSLAGYDGRDLDRATSQGNGWLTGRR